MFSFWNTHFFLVNFHDFWYHHFNQHAINIGSYLSPIIFLFNDLLCPKIFIIFIFLIIQFIHIIIKILSEHYYSFINHIFHFLRSQFVPFFFFNKLLGCKCFEIILFFILKINIILANFIVKLIVVILFLWIIKLWWSFIIFLAVLIIILFLEFIMFVASIYSFDFFSQYCWFHF
jgi:hypothetical protein